MNNAIRIAVPVLMAVLATGCMTPYKMKPGTPAASLELQKGTNAWICADSPPQQLIRDKKGDVAIPANKRVTIGLSFYTSDGYMSYSCSPSVSLIPEVGATYLQDFETENEACTALVYRKTDDKRVGLAFDATLGPGGPGCTK